MKLSKREIKKVLKSRNFDLEFEYRQKYGSIIPDYDAEDAYSLAFEGEVLDVDSLAGALNAKFFEGKSILEIYEDADFGY
ncbi:MAG: hypothetical protein Q4A72_05450 [Bacillota bacterium]|nr:hypothetical protein [Bacillota bacterium]